MIKIGITYLLLFITVTSYPQKNIDLTKAESFIVNLENKKVEASGKIDFNGIIVKDFRFDTTKLGYTNRTPKKIVFNTNSSQGFTVSLNNYYSTIFDLSSEKKLVVIVKSFWFKQDMPQEDSKNKIEDMTADLSSPGKCYVDLEIFAQTGNGYKALLKLKNDFDLPSYKRKDFDAVFFIPFDSVMNKIGTMNIADVLSKKRDFSREEIDINYTKRFDVPVLTATETKRGVFMTFADFKQNKTIYPDFKKKEGRLTDEVYNDQDDLLTDFWGFFDGRNYYIKIGHSIFKMVRQNNSFDLMGAKKITRETNYYNTYPATGMNPNTPPMTITTAYPLLAIKPLQLDMETGEVF